jgi:cytochrome c peroxidase
MRRFGIFIAVALATVSCGRKDERPIGAAVPIKAPLGLPAVPIPPDNPVTVETVALGRKLFYDRKLSATDSVSCASCHNPLLGFSDGRKVSAGVEGKTGKRNAPTVVNAAYGTIQFWDGRAADLEEQAAGPIANPVEMNQTHDVCVSKLNSDAAYTAQFAKAFGPGPITMGKIQKALASFERTVISGNSAFDRYQYGGDHSALGSAAIRGMAIFTDKAKGNCVTCHTIDLKYALFTDSKFHNLGVGVDSEGELVDLGRFEQTGAEADKGAFKTPTLRNIAKSAPYMHDGSLKTLREVVDFYAGGGNSNPHLDKDMKSLNLTRAERDDLVTFLESLTGEMPPNIGAPPAK